MDLRHEARELVRCMNQRMSASPYDIAWLARLRDDGQPRWPDLLEWLLENQHDDGSWGAEVVYYHDRIITTLAAAIALHYNGDSGRTARAVERAVRYLWRNLHSLHSDPFELVGFELTFPTLIAEAHAMGLDTPTHACGYDQLQLAKLKLIPPDMLYSPRVTSIHSLEFLGKGADIDRLRKAVSSNGSIGNSPAATAYYLSLGINDKHALDYLETVRRAYSGQVNILYPFRTFELTWVLNNLSHSGVPITEFAGENIWNELRAQLSSEGIGLDPTWQIPDGDITSVTSRLLREAGYTVDPSILAKYELPEKRIFRTYNFERNMSIGTNIHALEALHVMPDYPDRDAILEQITIGVLDKRIFSMYWTDKWHASPYYATAHVLIGFLRQDKYILHTIRPTVDWLLHTQREDGSWGYFADGTAEETAYALTALLHYHRYQAVDEAVLRRGAEFLTRTYAGKDSEYPALWIDKSLYVPHDVVRAAVLAALIMFEETVGNPAKSIGSRVIGGTAPLPAHP